MAIILLDHQLSVRHWTSLLARHFIMSHAMDNSSFWHCSQTLKPTSTVNVKVHYICTLYIVKVHVHLYINCTKQEWLCFFNTTKFMVLICFSIQWHTLLFIYEKVTFKQTLQHFKQNNMWRQLSNYIPITKNETSESHFLKSMLIITKGNVASEKIP